MNIVKELQKVDEKKADRFVLNALLTIVILAIVLSCVAMVTTTAQKMVAENQANQVAETQNGLAEPSDVFDDLNWAGLAWVVGALLGLFVFYKVFIETGVWKVLLGIAGVVAVIAALFWVLLYRGADVSTPEARDENLQIVKVIQPVGDPSVDSINSEINNGNAGANLKNAGGNAIYAMIFIAVFVVMIGGGIVMHYYIEARAGKK